MYSKADEAYLFLGASHTGYHYSCLEYGLVVIGELLHVVPSPDDERSSAILIRITPFSVERYQLGFEKDPVGSPAFLTPFDDGLYGMCRGGVLCKWTGNRFEFATEEEQRRLDGVKRLVRGDMDNQTVNGWLVRSAGRSPRDRFEVQVGNHRVISVQTHISGPNAWVSVDLQLPGQAAQSLYNVNGTPRRVSKTEYSRIFGKP